MTELLSNVRYALRTFRQAPGFVVVAVIALALGIGANSAIFSVLNAVLLRPLPYPDAQQLVMIWEDYQRRGGPAQEFTNPANFMDWQEQAQTFAAMYAFGGAAFTLTGDGEPERVLGASVTGGFFTTLGVAPALGRAFTAEEDRPGGAAALVLTHGLWQRRFGGDAAVVGKALLLNGNSYTVVGVMPAGFRMPLMSQAEFFVPMQAGRTGRGNAFLRAVGRIKPGVTLSAARAEMTTIAARLEQQYPEANAGAGLALVGLQEQLAGGARAPLLILMGAVGCVLLIACANVANLLLARASARQKEIAVRIALGAGRGHLLRQLLTESVLLGGAGAALGLLLASASVRLLLGAAPNLLPQVFDVRVDGWAVAFTLGLGLATGVAFGIVPALQATRPAMHDVLKDGGAAGSSAGGHRLRGALAITEIALSLVLLAGAGLLIRSFFAVLNVDTGFEPKNLLAMEVSAPRNRYPEGQQVAEFYVRLIERMKSLPQVEAVAASTSPPFSQNRMDRGYRVEGEPPLPPGRMQAAWARMVTPEYFSTARMRLIAGRAFDARDTVDAPPVVIVNEALAAKHWPGANPVGRRIAFGDGEEWMEVVGVAGNVRSFGLEREETPSVYLPYAATPTRALTLLVRTGASVQQIGGQLRALVREMDSEIPLSNLSTMESRMEGFLAQRRLTMLLLAVFAALALGLAAVGIYGVMAYSVAQRTREMGIRMALGAARGDVLRLVIGQGMTLAAAGVAIGLGAALGLSRYMASQVYGVSAQDPATFFSVAAALAAVALVACWVPARRATRVDPLVALRYE